MGGAGLLVIGPILFDGRLPSWIDLFTSMQMQHSNPRDELVQATVSIFDIVHALCQEFAAEWSSSARPDIATYLDRVDGSAKGTLIRNLLDYELRKRRKEDETPAIDDYLEKFPDFANVVRGLFVDVHSTYGGGDTPSTITHDAPPVGRLGSYRPVQKRFQPRFSDSKARNGLGRVFKLPIRKPKST